MLTPMTSSIKDLLKSKLAALENHFGADLIYIHGPIYDFSDLSFLKIIEEMGHDANKKKTLYVMLTTTGGSALAVERQVNILRHHYEEVNFIVPDFAYSAGTIYCMSGDNILMDYFSVLGPIDPQVQNRDGKWVAALGYLDKVNELLTKAANNTLTQAEFLILKDIDLAELRSYEQAKELTIDLLKRWLVKFKFKNWNIHQTNPALKGQPVTEEQKIKRAAEIADKLSDNNLWKSHGRPINIEKLEKETRLIIEDYGKNKERQKLIRDYYFLVSDFIKENKYKIFIQTRGFI